MSRDIDTSDLSALSQDDLEYLRVRGRLTAEQEAEYFGEEPEPQNNKPQSLDDVPYVGDENTLASVQTEEEGNGATLAAEDYEDSSNERLREELRRRGLSTGGNKAELIERLEDNDLENEG